MAEGVLAADYLGMIRRTKAPILERLSYASPNSKDQEFQSPF